MNAAAARLFAAVLLRQVLVGGIGLLLFLVVAPELLLLDAGDTQAARVSTLLVSGASEILTQVVIYTRLLRLRYLLRALALGSRAFEPEDLAELARVPAFVTAVSSGAATFFSLLTLLPPFRPPGFDLGTAASLLILALLVIAAAGLPLYVLLRSAVSGALELSPPEVAGEVLSVLERQGVPRRRVQGHMLAAVLTPIAFVALGAALVAHAHVRASAMQARIDTAIVLSRGVADALPGALPWAGRREALADAAERGYAVRTARAPALYAVLRREDGTVQVSVPLDDGHAEVEFQGSVRTLAASGVILASALVLVLAVWVGAALGRALSDDLVRATDQVRLLGNEEVLRGGMRVGRPARFEVVTALGQAIETLAERFRVFAAAQERAIEAREAALRLRGLLFASVSHDLKSPLNAILGFCALVWAEPLGDAQRESVHIIERRGRELLALIETILDAARVEAQRLTLVRAEVPLDEVLERALRRGDELGPMDAAPVEIVTDGPLPVVDWDDARMAQAIAALIGHAKRLSPEGGVRLEVRAQDPHAISISVHDPSRVFPVPELARLLDASNAATAPRRLGGLSLGLSLARSLINLHGGSLNVERGPEGGAVFRAVLPRRSKRPGVGCL